MMPWPVLSEPIQAWQVVVFNEVGQAENCACGTSLIHCVKCGDPRCLSCDPYDGSDICA